MEETYEMKDYRPETLADMAKIWNDTKFYGYFDTPYIVSLCEFCRCLEPYDSFPQLYYEYEGWEQLVCLEFHAGTETIMISLFDYANELKKENIPTHPEEQKDTVSSEEYDEWDNIYKTARNNVIERIVNMDGWKRQKIAPSNFTDAEALMMLYSQLMRH